MPRRVDGKKITAKGIHEFDADGVSVLIRRKLERENAILKAEVERLRRLLRAQARKTAATADPAPERQPTRH